MPADRLAAGVGCPKGVLVAQVGFAVGVPVAELEAHEHLLPGPLAEKGLRVGRIGVVVTAERDSCFAQQGLVYALARTNMRDAQDVYSARIQLPAAAKRRRKFRITCVRPSAFL